MIKWFKNLTDANKIAIVVPIAVVVIGGLIGLFKWQFRKKDGPAAMEKTIQQVGTDHTATTIGQAKPLIDVVPFGVVQTELKDENKTKMCVTLLSFINYSGFTAKNIAIDIKYGDNVWVSEWVQANIDSNRKKKAGDGKAEGVDPDVGLNLVYFSRREIAMTELKPGQTKKSDLEQSPLYASGQLDLKVNVVGKKEGFPILV
jgi:hypothetical protein